MLNVCEALIKQQGAVFHFTAALLIWLSLSRTSSHRKKHANTHTCALLGQVPQEIIIQLQNEDQKCHPLLLRSSSANPFLLGFSVFLHTSFFFFYTLSVLLHAVLHFFFCFLKCALFTCPLYSFALPPLLTVYAVFFLFSYSFFPLFFNQCLS